MASEPITGNSRSGQDFNVAHVWLDALSCGACSEDDFLQAVQKLILESPEAGWESLSLLDQYYRRGKINAELFRRLKTRLGAQLLGTASEFSIPLAA